MENNFCSDEAPSLRCEDDIHPTNDLNMCNVNFLNSSLDQKNDCGSPQLFLSRREIDELYDLSSFLISNFERMNIPYFLYGKSLLGAVRNHSILFDDCKVSIAIADSEKEHSIEQILESLLSIPQDSVIQTCPPNKYTYQNLPKLGFYRVISSDDPLFWVDIVRMRIFNSHDDLKTKFMEDRRLTDAKSISIENTLASIKDSFQKNQLSYPIYHFLDTSLIELQPFSYISMKELFPLNRSFTFGPITNCAGPRMPIRVLERINGKDCFTHYEKVNNNKGFLEEQNHCNEGQVKCRLTSDQYLPVKHSQQRDSTTVAHNYESFKNFLSCQKLIENSHFNNNSVATSLTTINRCESRKIFPRISQTGGAFNKDPNLKDDLEKKKKWFGYAVRVHTNESPKALTFDKSLRDVMEPHIAKARRKREEWRMKFVKKIGSLNSNSSDQIISISSNFGVPYPSLRQERSFLYDKENYPLHLILANTLGISDLTMLHEHAIKDKKEICHPILHPVHRHDFHQCYDNFVTGFCIPLLHSLAMTQNVFTSRSCDRNKPDRQMICYRYQAFPCIRIIRPGEFSIGPHCDTAYNHSVGNINFHIPLTPVYGTNALYTESHPGKEDWHPLATKSLGLGYIFDGARCLHFTCENTTSHTRVSLDFRIAISYHDSSESFSNSSNEKNANDFIRKIGDDISFDQYVNNMLCSKTVLEDNYSIFPGYYDEAFIDLGTGAHYRNQTFSPGPYVYKMRQNPKLFTPDRRVGFPF